MNGARFNDPFGDTVNWDLIPSIAIDTVNVEASNPVFGLNALGGSVNVQMKNGFTFHGGDFTGYGGSYNRGSGILEYGQQVGNFAIYGAGEITADGGFRDTSASNIYRLYTDLGWRRRSGCSTVAGEARLTQRQNQSARGFSSTGSAPTS